MISYELAKQLKDAGFPMVEINNPEDLKKAYELATTIHAKPFSLGEEVFYMPSLSYLIEQCGDDLDWMGKFEKMWGAHSRKNQQFDTRGASPEEAVAKLWLSLHTK